jgi:hypothetical protein
VLPPVWPYAAPSVLPAPEGGVRSGAITTLKRSWTRVGNHIGVWMYRTLDGRLSSGRKNVHVVMVTTPDRRTGIPRSTCVRYLETSAGPSSGALAPAHGETPLVPEPARGPHGPRQGTGAEVRRCDRTSCTARSGTPCGAMPSWPGRPRSAGTRGSRVARSRWRAGMTKGRRRVGEVWDVGGARCQPSAVVNGLTLHPLSSVRTANRGLELLKRSLRARLQVTHGSLQ